MSEKKGFKLNLIDWAILLVVALVVGFLLYRANAPAQVDPTAPTVDRMEYVVYMTPVDPEVIENAKRRIDSGETQLVVDGKLVDAYIVGLEIAPHYSSVLTDDGRLVRAEDPIYLDVYVTVQAPVANPITKLVFNQESRLGAGHTLRTMGVQMTGTIISIKELD